MVRGAAQSRETSRGLLLVHAGGPSSAPGPIATVERWAESGVVGLTVVPLERGWVGVVPTTGVSAVGAPYEDALPLLLNRSLPHRLRPAIGLGVVGRRGVVCVTPAGWRAVRRWLVWQPGRGVVHPGGLAVARLADLVRAAGVADPSAVGGLADVLHDPAGDARLMVADVLVALDLPGAALLDGGPAAGRLPGATVVQPRAVAVRRFAKATRENVMWRDEMEGSGR